LIRHLASVKILSTTEEIAMKVLRWLAAALLTLVLAVILLVRTIGTGLGAMTVENSNWVTNVSTGSADAGVMLKATIAIGGTDLAQAARL
jgi:hypothetical protein